MRLLTLTLCTVLFFCSNLRAEESQTYFIQNSFGGIEISIKTFDTYQVSDVVSMGASLESVKNGEYVIISEKIHSNKIPDELKFYFKNYISKANEMIDAEISYIKMILERYPDYFRGRDVLYLGEEGERYSLDILEKTKESLNLDPQKFIDLKYTKLGNGLEVISVEIDLQLQGMGGNIKKYHDLYSKGMLVESYSSGSNDLIFIKNEKGDIYAHNAQTEPTCFYDISIFHVTENGFGDTAKISIIPGECI